MKNVENSSDGRNQGVPKISGHSCIGRMGALRDHLCDSTAFLLAHSKNELIQWRGVRRLSVCLSVKFCANRFFSQTNGPIATKLAHDGIRVSMHPACAQGQGQGQRSRDTRTFLDSWNELLRH